MIVLLMQCCLLYFYLTHLCYTTKNGMKYTLASGKLVKDKQNGGVFAREKSIELLYIRAKSLQADLERVCSFSSLKPEKIVARLGKKT